MPKSVLLIDDDHVSCFINEKILKMHGVTDRIHTVHNGMAALDFIQENCNNSDVFPELILLDIHMPIMNGFEFMESFLKLALGIPSKVFILTSSTNAIDRKRAEQFPIAGYLTKPLKLEELDEHLK